MKRKNDWDEYEEDHPVRDALLAGGCFTWVVVSIVIACVVGTLVYLSLYTDILNLKREAVQHSNQYIQSKVTELVESHESWQALETKKALYADNTTLVQSFAAQQAAIMRRMCNAYALIPADVQQDEVPAYIRSFLECD